MAAEAWRRRHGPAIDTTALEDVLREAYDRLSAQFGNLEGGVDRGNGAVVAVLREIEQTLDRNTAANSGLRPEEEQEHKDEGSEASGTGGGLLATPTGGGSPHSSDVALRTPIDSIRASLIAGTPIEPAYTPERALELGDRYTSPPWRHRDCTDRRGNTKDPSQADDSTSEHLFYPHASNAPVQIRESKPGDLSTSNLSIMLQLMRLFRGTGMPANSGSISAPATVEMAEPAVQLLATLLLERGTVELLDTPAAAPTGLQDE
jgi:hypothetical protein